MDWARRILYRQSLRGWMALALVLAVLPLLTSAVVGYAVYHRTIVSPFRDVLTVQHATLVSLERIHDDYWQVAEAVNGYLLSGDTERAVRYAAVAAEVEAQFERLSEAVAADPALVALIGVARAEWSALARDAETVLARPREGLAGAVPDIDRVAALERELPVAAQRLEQIVERLRSESEAHHAAALVALRRLEIGAAAALILSVLMMGLGAWVVNRAIVLGTDRLVEGARRVASGQREEPVAVTVPPELAAVANAFNDMTRTIVEQEARLREFGRRDALTSLLNRREFDHALEQRAAPWTGEPYALLLIDIDRFKRINDTHGHAVGDAVLRAVALRLAASARQGLPPLPVRRRGIRPAPRPGRGGRGPVRGRGSAPRGGGGAGRAGGRHADRRHDQRGHRARRPRSGRRGAVRGRRPRTLCGEGRGAQLQPDGSLCCAGLRDRSRSVRSPWPRGRERPSRSRRL